MVCFMQAILSAFSMMLFLFLGCLFNMGKNLAVRTTNMIYEIIISIATFLVVVVMIPFIFWVLMKVD